MKTQDEIQKARDRLIGILVGEVPVPMTEKTKLGMTAAADALSWVLDDEPEGSFAKNLANCEAATERLGFNLERPNN